MKIMWKKEFFANVKINSEMNIGDIFHILDIFDMHIWYIRYIYSFLLGQCPMFCSETIQQKNSLADMTSERLTLEYSYINIERQYRSSAKWKNKFGSYFKYPSVK